MGNSAPKQIKAKAVRETEKAILIEYQVGTGVGQSWIPKSQIDIGSEVMKDGDEGILSMSAWFYDNKFKPMESCGATTESRAGKEVKIAHTKYNCFQFKPCMLNYEEIDSKMILRTEELKEKIQRVAKDFRQQKMEPSIKNFLAYLGSRGVVFDILETEYLYINEDLEEFRDGQVVVHKVDESDNEIPF